MNDQVLDFDMSFDFLWFAPIPRQSGIESIGGAQGGRVISGTTSSIRDKHKTKESVNKHSANVKTSRSLSRQEHEKDRRSARAEFDEKQKANKYARQKRIESKPTTKFADNYLVKEPSSRNILPTSHYESREVYGNSNSIEDTADAGKSFVSSAYSQIASNANTDLMNLDLKIKGDPFWLANEPYPVNATKSKGVEEIIKEELASETNDTLSNVAGEVYYIFTSQTPTLESTLDQKAFTQNTVLNGLYQVINVVSTFNDGKFMQELQSTRNYFVDVNDIQPNRR